MKTEDRKFEYESRTIDFRVIWMIFSQPLKGLLNVRTVTSRQSVKDKGAEVAFATKASVDRSIIPDTRLIDLCGLASGLNVIAFDGSAEEIECKASRMLPSAVKLLGAWELQIDTSWAERHHRNECNHLYYVDVVWFGHSRS